MNKIKAGIIGAAGYTGGELIRLLVNHPFVDISFMQSKSQDGKFVYEVHPDLLGDSNLKFVSSINGDADVLFFCLGHGDSKKFLKENIIPDATTIIDLSQDFRLDENFVYGLPELNRDKIKNHKRIANPGCFATCIELGLLPLANKKLLQNEIHINSTTGSTGAGQSLSATTHFSWRSGNMSSYKAFEHQHLAEINNSILQLQPDFKKNISLIPNRGSFTRGIFSSIYTDVNIGIEEAINVYEDFYNKHPFVYICQNPIDLKQVVNTNKCIIHLEKHGNKLLITSIIDNLLKGASGQALQNMNISFGFDEKAGLNLKASAF
jgi:N-acetyl-gamma-glutamyl-phosphate reductase